MGMTKKQPPHLPEKKFSEQNYHFWQNIRFIFYVVVISLLAGITGSLIVSAWLEPSFYSNEGGFLINKNYNSQKENISTWSQTPSALAAKRLEFSTINIFDKTLEVSQNFYPESAFVGRAAMLSSNGWGVIYYPDFNKNKLSTWLALDSQGLNYEIENTLFDSERGFVYIKFVGNNFRVMSFPNWDNFTNGTKVWVSDYNVWKERQLGDTIVVVDNPHKITEQYSRLHLEPDTKVGDIVMTEEGHFVGFVDKEGLLQTAWYSEYQLSNLLEKNEFVMSDIDWVGYFVERHGVSDIAQTPGKGFFVVNAGKNSADLKKGDIITEVNGNQVDPHNLWRVVVTTKSDLKLTLWRNNKEVNIIINNFSVNQ